MLGVAARTTTTTTYAKGWLIWTGIYSNLLILNFLTPQIQNYSKNKSKLLRLLLVQESSFDTKALSNFSFESTECKRWLIYMTCKKEKKI
ncbi:hypothetical protein BpHYR1_044416 [Brachionus plicatilis]|uniref:Uncharacterized protein n=1 Tax=Brachionus plicatilis TaxID=10195 RepID=A0A3M7RGW3_BRAPC|nr:hypothetical protein BpHYR1_044416 [Brachionus plicatilis]